MALLTLSPEWARLMKLYEADHQNPMNQACHTVGVPMVASSVALGVTVVGLPLAVPLFALGWTFQFVGHAFEGKKPSFVSDPRQLLVGLMWWTRKVGLGVVDPEPRA